MVKDGFKRFFDDKKGFEIEAWKTTAIYILLALAFLLILYIVLNVIIKRIKAIYF